MRPLSENYAAMISEIAKRDKDKRVRYAIEVSARSSLVAGNIETSPGDIYVRLTCTGTDEGETIKPLYLTARKALGPHISNLRSTKSGEGFIISEFKERQDTQPEQFAIYLAHPDAIALR